MNASNTPFYDPNKWNGTVCTLAELQLSNSDRNAPIHCLTRGDSIGLTVTVEAAFLSLTAVLIVFALIARNYLHNLWYPPPGKWRLIQEPMDLYMLSLFLSDLIQALGTIMDARWIHTGKVEDGPFCVAQGAVQELGETTVAMTTFAIAVHTFFAVWWSKGVHSMKAAYCAVICIWTYVVLFVSVGIGLHPSSQMTFSDETSNAYMTPTPYWCWIGSRFLVQRILGEYFWLWITLVTSLLVYIPLHLWSRGNITIHQGKWFGFRIHRANNANIEGTDRKRRSFDMLVYPIVYCALILPLSIVRWMTFKSVNVSPASTFIVSSIYGLSGFCNVALFLVTRPNLLLFTPRSHVAAGLPPSPLPSHRDDLSEVDIGMNLRGVGAPPFSAYPVNLGQLPDENDGWELPALNRSSLTLARKAS